MKNYLQHSTFLNAFVAQTFVTTLCLVFILRLWKVDLRVPFNYWGDTLYFLSLTKSIADGGWIWMIPRLGAPFGLEIVAFPINITFSSLIMKLISFFTSEPGLII